MRSATAVIVRRRWALLLAAAAVVGGCGKGYKKNPYQGTWFHTDDRGGIKAIEFTDKGKARIYPSYGDKADDATYDVISDHQFRLSGDGHTMPLDLDVHEGSGSADSTVTASDPDDANHKLTFRWLKEGETVESAEKNLRAAADAKRQAEYAHQRQVADAEQKAAQAKTAARAAKIAELWKSPNLVVVVTLDSIHVIDHEIGYALDVKPVAGANGGQASPGVDGTVYAGTAWAIGDQPGQYPVTIRPQYNQYEVTFGPPVGGPPGQQHYPLSLAVTDSDGNPQLTTRVNNGQVQQTLFLVADVADHARLIAASKAEAATTQRDAAANWWLAGPGRQQLSDAQQAQLQSVAKQVDAKYGQEWQLTPAQRQARAKELADLNAAVLTPAQMADEADCQSLLNFWAHTVDRYRGTLPADQAAAVEQVLAQTPDLTVFRAPADPTPIPPDAKEWLIGQRREWANAHSDFVVTSAGLHPGSLQNGPRFIVCAERPGVSADGDRVVLYADGRVDPLSADAAQKALDAQARLWPATGPAGTLPDAPVTNSIGMTFVPLKPGSFTTMVSGQDVAHKVTLTRGFLMAAAPVSQKQWVAVMGDHGAAAQPARAPGRRPTQRGQPGAADPTDVPLGGVTWDTAVDFCQRLSAKEGKRYRLPTEAEWMYAAQTNADGSPADDPTVVKNRRTNSPDGTAADQLVANARGIRGLTDWSDTWCLDHAAAFTADDQTDPCVRAPAGNAYIIRGGPTRGLAGRGGFDWSVQYPHVTIRVVMDAE